MRLIMLHAFLLSLALLSSFFLVSVILSLSLSVRACSLSGLDNWANIWESRETNRLMCTASAQKPIIHNTLCVIIVHFSLLRGGTLPEERNTFCLQDRGAPALKNKTLGWQLRQLIWKESRAVFNTASLLETPRCALELPLISVYAGKSYLVSSGSPPSPSNILNMVPLSHEVKIHRSLVDLKPISKSTVFANWTLWPKI